MAEKIRSKGIYDNIVKMQVNLMNTKGTIAFINLAIGNVSKYLMDNDLPLAFIEMEKNVRGDKLFFIFKENEFENNKESCIDFVKKFMNELWELNTQSAVPEEKIEEIFPSMLDFKNNIKKTVNKPKI